jgi:competence protein ComEA
MTKISVAAFALVLFLPALHAQAPSTAAMKEKAETICTACHGLEVAEGAPRPKADWSQVVQDMVQKGADGSKSDLEMVVNYLAIQYGPDIMINKASAQDLQAQLDLTAKQAADLVQYRTDKGDFKSMDDLAKVAGIPADKFGPLQSKIKF